jgi:hypothetical protein
MKEKGLHLLFIILILVWVSLFSCGSRDKKGEGKVIISYRLGKNFPGITEAPNSACWIEDAQGNFIRTLFVSEGTARALNKGEIYLRDWYKASRGETDATTGASLKVDAFHSHLWDCRNSKGNLVKSGVYIYKVETSTEDNQNDTTAEGKIEIRIPPSGKERYIKSEGGPAYRKIFDLDGNFLGVEEVTDCIEELKAEYIVSPP